MAIDTETLFDVAMELRATDVPNVRQAVPFFNVKDIEASLRFYVEGLGFTITRHWDLDGRIRWCWLELGRAAVMLQEYWKHGRPGGHGPGSVHLLHVRGRDRRLSALNRTCGRAALAAERHAVRRTLCGGRSGRELKWAQS